MYTNTEVNGIADKNLSIVECNKNFAKLMGREIEEMYNDLPGLEGADLSKITRLFTFFQKRRSAQKRMRVFLQYAHKKEPFGSFL